MVSHLGYIERGRIREAADDGYIVESLDRDGIVSPPLSPITDSIYLVGDMVLFVLFPDGTGKIISNA